MAQSKAKTVKKPAKKADKKPEKKIVKKAAPAAKSQAKSAPSKKSAEKVKAAKPGVGAALVKTASKLVAKIAGKSAEPKAAPAAKAAAAKPAPKADKKSAGKDKSKDKKAKADDSDDLFLDDGIEAEDIPELEEFVAEPLVDEEDDEDLEAAQAAPESDEIILTDAEGRRYCRVKDCDQVSTVEGYCRYHYLLLWKKIQVRRKILTDGKLERYVEELTSRYPDKFLEMIKKDLRSEKEFLTAIAELEIDESAIEGEFEEDTQYIEEVRGLTSEPTMSDDDEF